MAVTASMVKELREMTGAGMMDCKKRWVKPTAIWKKRLSFFVKRDGWRG